MFETPDGEKFENEEWFTRFMRGRRNEIASLLLAGSGVFLLGAALTYDPTDPSLNTASGSSPSNAFGEPGAIAADMLLQSLGWAGVAMAVMLVAWGATMFVRGPLRRGPKIVTIRLIAGALAVSGLAIAASSLPVPATWRIAAGLGGALGDVMHAEAAAWLLTAHMPHPNMVAGVVGLLAGLLGLFAGYGVTPADIADAADAARFLSRRAKRTAGLLSSRYLSRLDAEIVRLEPIDDAPALTYADVPTARAHPPVQNAPHSPPGYDQAPPSYVPPPAYEPPIAPAAPAPEPAAVEPAYGYENPVPAAPPRRAPPFEPVTPPAPHSLAPVAEAPLADAAIAAPPDIRPPRRIVAPDLFGGAEGFELPPFELLTNPPPRAVQADDEEVLERAEELESVLLDFSVKGQVVNTRPGPVVTLFEFEPAPGVRSSRVINLADDIARSMGALSARVAVVPGRNVIGIELPNDGRETVYLRRLLNAESYTDPKAALPLALGETIGGEPFVADLARMPHLLIAGTTGSGKSVGINAMILSLMYSLPPERCRFIMIDPKMLELSVYDGVPHLLAPVVTDPKKAVAALKWVVREMEDRYRRMSSLGVRNIAGFNRRLEEARRKGEPLERTIQTGYDSETGAPIFERCAVNDQPMPYLVVVIDEMADLMLVAGKDIESAVQRLAQMARAAGIHLITATQRPSVDVITGTIKANFPTRISFHVTSKIDSRTILGEQGAEQLLGQGDLLHLAPGGRIRRLHGPFVSDEEVEKVASFLKAQGDPEYVEGVTDEPEGENGDLLSGLLGDAGDGSDELYDMAVAVVTRDRRASTSYLQRKLKIGYNRAAEIMDRLEAEGVVSPANHAGKREILAPAAP
ncbi:MAG: DNA translocase FtsK 4TM domain-containing protein, partial [Caulobacterales bacterium]|nr:DNA translocase FtsK 4TM domain-containing protein [Caulobacterales bacterium]